MIKFLVPAKYQEANAFAIHKHPTDGWVVHAYYMTGPECPAFFWNGSLGHAFGPTPVVALDRLLNNRDISPKEEVKQ